VSNELAARNGGEVQAFDGDKVDLLKRVICPGATNDELELFIHACKRTGLDPFMRQIHAIKRKGKLAIQTGIDGYRLIADRTGRYAGNDDPAFAEGERFPVKATVTVYKIVGNLRCPFTATARWDEYYPGDGEPGFMWRRMPHVMLGKVAEALALRKAFPAELSGVYTADEMAQADGGAAAPVDEPAAPDPLADDDEFKQRLAEAFRQRGWAVGDSDRVTGKVLAKHRAESLTTLSVAKRREFIASVASGALDKLKDKAADRQPEPAAA
jgi:phage recombination protein Bet